MKTIFPQMAAHVESILTHYKNDFYEHDARSLGEAKTTGTKLLWFLYPMGTYVVWIDRPDYPNLGTRWWRSHLPMVECIWTDRKEAKCFLVEVEAIDPNAPPTAPWLRPLGKMTEITLDAAKEMASKKLASLSEPEERGEVVTIACPEYFDRVKAEVAEHGLESQFEEAIDYLRHYGDNFDHYRCQVSQDFAKWGFAIYMEVREHEEAQWKKLVNGGLIFHENEQKWRMNT